MAVALHAAVQKTVSACVCVEDAGVHLYERLTKEEHKGKWDGNSDVFRCIQTCNEKIGNLVHITSLFFLV